MAPNMILLEHIKAESYRVCLTAAGHYERGITGSIG